MLGIAVGIIVVDSAGYDGTLHCGDCLRLVMGTLVAGTLGPLAGGLYGVLFIKVLWTLGAFSGGIFGLLSAGVLCRFYAQGESGGYPWSWQGRARF